MLLKNLSALALVAALAAPAMANGVISEFPAGGVVFKEAADIAIAREDLYLSLREVRVHYDYQSDAKQTQRHAIGFPMPKVPVDFGPSHLGGVELLEDESSLNYMKFSAEVNGEAVPVVGHEYAWIGEANITSELEALGIPLYVESGEALDEAFAKVDPKVVEDFVARGMLIVDDEGSPDVALWEYQTVFEWEQDFAPGITKVDISYVPLAGYPGDIGEKYHGGGEYDEPEYVRQVRDEYCIDDALIRALKKRLAANESYEVMTLGYVVMTGNMWKGPIGEFNLTVDKADNGEDMQDFDFVAFCPEDSKKVSDTEFTWSAKDFVAERDIEVLLYAFHAPYAEEVSE